MRYRSKKYGLKLRPKKRIDLNKSVFIRLYVKEGKTTREIAKTLGCSFETVRVRCKEFGIPLRKPGNKILNINELALGRLYLREDKSMPEIAKILDCSLSTIYKWVNRFGVKKQLG